jgi:transposase-like protein
VTARVSPTHVLRAEIDALCTGDRDLVEVLEDVARLGARMIIQTAVEAEVEAFLGRARYQRTAATGDGGDAPAVRAGHRNGYSSTTIKSTAGPITVQRPKLRGTTEKFASRLFGTHVTRTNALESLVIASFVRGLSVRDVENALADALGPEAALSKSTVSTICQAIRTEYATWRERELSGVVLDYLLLDASAINSMMTDRQSLTPYLRFPIEHHKRIRHSNFIERTFGETRRRVKVIGRFPGETSCVRLVWAVLDRAARGFTMTAVALRTPHDPRRALLDPLTQLRPTTTATVTATADAA